MLIINIVIFGYIFVAFLLIYFFNRRRKKVGTFFHRKPVLTWIAIIILGIGILCAVDARFIEPYSIRIKHQAIPFPTSQPIKVGLISDMQVGMHKRSEWMEKVVVKTNEVQPDIILIA